MLFGEAGQQLLAFLLQFLSSYLQTRTLLQQGLGFAAQVEYLFLAAELIEAALSALQLLFQIGQLAIEEGQCLFCLGGFAVDVLAHIKRADFIEDAGGQNRIGVLQADLDNARLLALLLDDKLALQGLGG